MAEKIQKRLLTIEETSEYLSISPKGLYNMVYRREIPFVKIKGKLRFDIREIDNWIEEQKVVDSESWMDTKVSV
jgi:excisionase family DNA binding protein